MVIGGLWAFQRKKYVIAIVSFAIGLVWILYFRPLMRFTKGIGIDSISETQEFDWHDALFFLTSVFRGITPSMRFHYVLAYIALAVGAYFLAVYLMRRMKVREFLEPYFILLVVIAATSVSLFLTYREAMGTLAGNSNAYLKVVDNFDVPTPRVSTAEKAPTLVVYIGESTTAMNMSLYGYPRQTTPHLGKLAAQDPNLLVFTNVFSSHTHTSPSLLEAFSIAAEGDPAVVPIDERKRVSIIDILAAAQIKSHLFSSQGQSGNWNMVNPVVFRRASRLFSVNNKFLGNGEMMMKRPYDHVFFAEHLTPALDKLATGGSGRGIVFLHSVAGHGPYLFYLPKEFHAPVDGTLASMPAAAVSGAVPDTLSLVDPYDSAVKYVDYSVTRSLEAVKARNEPIVFMYFSDHGESVYTHRSHESSRFILEMARVPFVVYFNDAARREFPALYEKYVMLSRTKAISTLTQLPATLFDLLGVNVERMPEAQAKVAGSSDVPSNHPILVRRTNEGVTYVNLNRGREANGAARLIYTSASAATALIDRTDSATAVFLATHNNAGKAQTCYQGAHSWAKAVRGAMSADCLEFDLSVETDGALSIYNPAGGHVQFELKHMTAAVKRSQRALWIAARNIHQPAACEALAAFFEREKSGDGKVLVEFPAESEGAGLRDCSQRLRAAGLMTSYRVPSDAVAGCARALADSQNALGNANCQTLQKSLSRAQESGLFTDVSFDAAGLPAIEKMQDTDKLRWNARNVSPEAFNSFAPGRFGMVALNNDDPNSR